MAQLILASHGPLAQAIKESAAMICGNTDSVKSFCLYQNDSADDFYEEIKASVIPEEDTLLIVDFPGGTPAIKGLTLLSEFPKLKVITGMNSMMIIETILSMDQVDFEELVSRAMATGRDSISEIKYEDVDYEYDDL